MVVAAVLNRVVSPGMLGAAESSDCSRNTPRDTSGDTPKAVVGQP